jgi:hypothetical protein
MAEMNSDLADLEKLFSGNGVSNQRVLVPHHARMACHLKTEECSGAGEDFIFNSDIFCELVD